MRTRASFRFLWALTVLGASCGVSVAAAPAAGKAATAATLPVHAKSVIQIWMWGGPPHVDTFDPKPAAGYDYCGPLNKPLETNVKGMYIGELLPQLAKQADKYSLIRSMTHGVGGHETAAYIMQTGHRPGVGLVYPGVGAVTTYFRGYGHGYEGLLPPYIVLTEAQGRFSEAGFLGPLYKPFATGGNPADKLFVVQGIVVQGMTDERQRGRRELMHNLDTLGHTVADNPEFKQLDEYENKAYELILGDAGKVFDLNQEPAAVRDSYGRNTFGQSCLAARRLVERGVPYVTINYQGWDSHKRHFETMRRKLPEFDQGLAALLADLSDHKLLDTTIVWCGGEFGRTPKVDWGEPWNGGRGHYGNVFSYLVAGGGFKGGQVVGSSNATGAEVATRPVYPQDLIGSIYTLLGIDPDGPLPNPRGEKLTVLPPSDSGPGKGRLSEIMPQ